MRRTAPTDRPRGDEVYGPTHLTVNERRLRSNHTNNVNARHKNAPVRLGPGTNVLVEWHGTWYPARVLRALGAALVRIRYVGSGREWDEAVDATRVRMPAKN